MEDGERCIAARKVHVNCLKDSAAGRAPPVPGLVVISNRLLHIFEGSDEDGSLALIGKHPWNAVKHISVSAGRQGLEVKLTDVTYDIRTGEKDITWSLLRIFAEVPTLGGISIGWICTPTLKELCRAIELDLPDSHHPMHVTDTPIADVSVMYEARMRLDRFEAAVGIELVLLAHLKRGDGALHMLVLTETVRVARLPCHGPSAYSCELKITRISRRTACDFRRCCTCFARFTSSSLRSMGVAGWSSISSMWRSFAVWHTRLRSRLGLQCLRGLKMAIMLVRAGGGI